MRVVALISGGKDSCFNMMQCVAAGHEIVALANLQPDGGKDELDSYMYQTVGHDGISMYSEAMELPLFRRFISGSAVILEKEYAPVDGDEVEDLYLLLSEIKACIDFDAVSVGAILSDYQRIRVENVCARLGCVSLAYLWRRNQSELLQEMIDCGINAIIIKTASLGLDPDLHLGQTIAEMQPHLLKSKEKFGINVCGEGGEYETFTLDCPLFKKSLVLDDYEKVIHSNDAIAPVGYLKLNKIHLVEKTASDLDNTEEIDGLKYTVHPSSQRSQIEGVPVKTPLDYLSELAECNKADCCDGRDEICPKRKIEDTNNLGVDASTFSSNSSSCSGGGVGDTDSVDNINRKSDVESVISSSLVVSNEKTNGIEAGTAMSMNCEKESLPFSVRLKVTSNPGGWCWIMGPGSSLSAAGDTDTDLLNNPMKTALISLQQTLIERDMTLRDIVSIVMYVSSMEEYAQYNSEYIKFFSSQPPVRVCVETLLPADKPIFIEALAFRDQSENGTNPRHGMHVQGISHWAPANIGPYSQCVWVRDIIYVAGQIGLVPGTMKLVEGGARMECKLALRHLNRIMKATDYKVELRDVVQGICYVTDPSFIVKCREEWEKRTNNAIVEYIVVPRLPRDAHVEWQVWAHKHNGTFEYEETGCYIGSGVKVKIIRRWNYESRVAVIVCRASICDQTGKVGRAELSEITDYALSKLLQEAAEAEKSLECAVRIFYRLGALNPADIYDVFEKHSSSVAYSIIPVCSLVHENTVLSICGVRHQ